MGLLAQAGPRQTINARLEVAQVFAVRHVGVVHLVVPSTRARATVTPVRQVAVLVRFVVAQVLGADRTGPVMRPVAAARLDLEAAPLHVAGRQHRIVVRGKIQVVRLFEIIAQVIGGPQFRHQPAALACPADRKTHPRQRHQRHRADSQYGVTRLALTLVRVDPDRLRLQAPRRVLQRTGGIARLAGLHHAVRGPGQRPSLARPSAAQAVAGIRDLCPFLRIFQFHLLGLQHHPRPAHAHPAAQGGPLLFLVNQHGLRIGTESPPPHAHVRTQLHLAAGAFHLPRFQFESAVSDILRADLFRPAVCRVNGFRQRQGLLRPQPRHPRPEGHQKQGSA